MINAPAKDRADRIGALNVVLAPVVDVAVNPPRIDPAATGDVELVAAGTGVADLLTDQRLRVVSSPPNSQESSLRLLRENLSQRL